MENTTVTEGKTIAIISYITFIGTIIAFIMNNDKKNSFAAFHIRQMIGIILLGIVINVIARVANLGMISTILGFVPLIFWVIGFIGVLQGEEKKIPLLGDMFQEWFKGIG